MRECAGDTDFRSSRAPRRRPSPVACAHQPLQTWLPPGEPRGRTPMLVVLRSSPLPWTSRVTQPTEHIPQYPLPNTAWFLQAQHPRLNSKQISVPGDLIHATPELLASHSVGRRTMPPSAPQSPSQRQPRSEWSRAGPPHARTYLSMSLSLLRCWKKEGSQMSWLSWHTCLHDCPGLASFTCSALRGGHITCPWQKS